MSPIGDDLLDCLRSVDRPGDYCVGGQRQIFMPAIDVDGLGRMAFPVLPGQAERLIAMAEAAPYGRGEDTLVDREVRRTWQIEPRTIRIGGRQWENTLAELVADAALGLGIGEPVAADFYKLLIYDAGSFFVDHRDTEKVPGMFATLVIVLPSAHNGGELVVRHLGREVVFDLRSDDPSEVGFVAFYADCVHEVRPVIAGCRLTLVYNLRFLDRRRPLEAPDYGAEQQRVAALLRSWPGAEDAPDKLILTLEHAYTPAELSFGTLKGADAGVASVLVAAAAETDCDLHLALLSIDESGSAEHTDIYRGRSWRRDEEEEGDEDDQEEEDDEEEGEEFEVVEVFDRDLVLSEWRRPDGHEAAFSYLPFTEDELCPRDAFDDLTPDEEYFREASGNEGASFERTYRRAGLVLWPRVRRLAVLNQAGRGITLPHLEDLTTRWEREGAGTESPLWREADALSGHMLSSWPEASWRTEGDTAAGQMLDLLVRLGHVARIDAFLDERTAEGHYAASDNEAIVRAAALLPRARAADLLVRIVRRNAPGHLGACCDLWRRCVAAPAGPVGEPASIGAALLDLLPGDPAKPPQLDSWQRPRPVEPGFVVDLLTISSQVDAGLASRAIEHMLAWPKTYGPDDVLVPAALALAKQAERTAGPALRRLREASLDHLRRRIAVPLEAPRDWARANPLNCTCPHCRGLGAFLVAPDERHWRLKAVERQRIHVEQSARGAGCDLDLTTERRGSPYTLLATKNQASYERRARQRRQDLEHVSALAG